jgi:hypothetical protein
MQLADALIRANRTFDMLILPNRNHDLNYDPYFIKRKFDYFVEHLLGATPPEYVFFLMSSLIKSTERSVGGP